ncbi:hypothetical protein JOL62DRAFT_149271 [Phyllosticta paracitricarpa]|uniref:Uncharacterized protein n=1 Tax=Phyllosticta paracitricarpa TaxID=2016321 RepID=A0ABR1N3Y7_9PEZI
MLLWTCLSFAIFDAGFLEGLMLCLAMGSRCVVQIESKQRQGVLVLVLLFWASGLLQSIVFAQRQLQRHLAQFALVTTVIYCDLFSKSKLTSVIESPMIQLLKLVAFQWCQLTKMLPSCCFFSTNALLTLGSLAIEHLGSIPFN